MKLIDANAQVHPDDSMTLMTVEKQLDRTTNGCPAEIKAIPVKYIRELCCEEPDTAKCRAYVELIEKWEADKANW